MTDAITDDEEVLHNSHTVRGTKRYGVIVDCGQGVIGTETIRDYRDNVLIPYARQRPLPLITYAWIDGEAISWTWKHHHTT